jgi:5-oxoprolinase (ATP-hydrolysing) subunit A
MLKQTIDLNCDMGESFGAYRMGDDSAVLPFVTSANIACGMHAGDPGVMRRTVAAAATRGVAVGAHPGFPDLPGFGRREMRLTPDEIYDLVVYQVGALMGFTSAAVIPLRHVKPHGALYNMSCAVPALAEAVANAVRDVNPRLSLFGLPGSALERAANTAGLRFVREAFADRGYAPDGSLVPRGRPGSMLNEEGQVVRRALRMVLEGKVRAADGSDISIQADTLCVHGDGAHAAGLARGLRAGLEAAGVLLAPPGVV